MVGNMTGYRLLFTNPARTIVVTYDFPTLDTELAPGDSTGYSLTFSANSTFTGVYIVGYASGGELQGFAGIQGSKADYKVAYGNSQSVDMIYLVSEGSYRPYVLGALNPLSTDLNVTISPALMTTCGDTWISQATVLGS
jgi:hypothetical protein